MEFYLFIMKGERSEEIKSELFTQGEVPVLMHSPKVWEHPWDHALGCPYLRRTQLYWNLPYNEMSQVLWDQVGTLGPPNFCLTTGAQNFLKLEDSQ
jgi:hypothetical protein